MRQDKGGTRSRDGGKGAQAEGTAKGKDPRQKGARSVRKDQVREPWKHKGSAWDMALWIADQKPQSDHKGLKHQAEGL